MTTTLSGTRMTSQPFRRFLLSGLMALLPAIGTQAADFPARPITIAVPYAASGGGDVLARLFAGKLRKDFATWQNVIKDGNITLQ